MKAAHIMTRRVITAGPGMSIGEATRILSECHISGLPVVDEEGRVIGVFSATDAISKRGDVVGDVMTAPAITVEPDTSMEEVAALLSAKDINRLPVIEEGRLVGIICRADIVRYLATRRAWAEARQD